MLRRTERAAASASTVRTAGGESLPSLASLFTFTLEERIEADGMACYKPQKGCTQLLLPIPLEAATNRAEVDAYEERASLAKRQKLEGDASAPVAEEEPVVPIVPFAACLAKMVRARAPAPEPKPEPKPDFHTSLAMAADSGWLWMVAVAQPCS